MSTKPKPSAVVFAKDVAKLARFYGDVAGLEKVHSDSDHVVLDGGHFQLVVHGIPKKVADRIEITEPPRIRDATPIKICLPVRSIKKARTQAAGLGGRVGAKEKEWQARGFTACDGHDPEGNVFQVREMCADYQARIGWFEEHEFVALFRRKKSVAVVWKQTCSKSADEFVAEAVFVPENGKWLVDHAMVF